MLLTCVVGEPALETDEELTCHIPAQPTYIEASQAKTQLSVLSSLSLRVRRRPQCRSIRLMLPGRRSHLHIQDSRPGSRVKRKGIINKADRFR